MPKKRKGKFRLSKNTKPAQNVASTLPPMEMEQTSKNTKPYSYITKVLLYISVLILTTLLGDKGLRMLSDVPPKIVFILVLFALCVYIGWGVWVFTGWISKWRPFRAIKGRLIITILIILVIIIIPPTYAFIGHFIEDLGNIEMPEFGDDSSQVLVHYGRRTNDFFWTQKTVGDLKQNSVASLTVNGKDIFDIHTDGRTIFVDATLFAGYGGLTEADNFTIEWSQNFSFNLSGYFITDAPRDGSTKYFVRKGPNFGLIVDPTTSGKITAYTSGQPMLTTNNVFKQVVIKDNWGEMPKGWSIQHNNMGFEVTNENNIPTLVLEYKSPNEITIAGLFVTPCGILKVDNSKDVIFELMDTIPELGTYTVDKVLPPRSFFDLFSSERTYIIYEVKKPI